MSDSKIFDTKHFSSFNFWIALTIYATTLVNFSPFYFVPFFLLFIYFQIKKTGNTFLGFVKFRFTDNKTNWILLIIFISCFLNSLVHYHNFGIIKVLKGPYIAIPFLWLIANTINKHIFKYIILFTIIETFVGICEYIVGLNSFYFSLDKFEYFTSYELLSNTRVYGLSLSPSIFSEKIFISLLLIDFLYQEKRGGFIVKCLFFIGLVISFTRTVLLGLYFYLIIQLIISFLTKNKSLKDMFFVKKLIFIFMVFVVSFSNIQFFKNQFTRGGITEKTSGRINNIVEVEKTNINSKIISENDSVIPSSKIINNDVKQKEVQGLITKMRLKKIEMSGRSEIWSNYILYIKKNIFFGNGSNNIKIGKYHAHNSYLHLLAMNGLLISLLYLLFFILNFRKQNLLIIIGILLLGMGQYAFFWPLSFVDLILFSFLLTKNYKNE